MTFGDQVLIFIKNLHFPEILPDNIAVLHPFSNLDSLDACLKFYDLYYNDNNARWMIIGINPGRFGGGITGIPFTDPVRLQNNCSIPNSFKKRQELSSVFIYEMITEFGGVKSFYDKFYITAVSPLGFTKNNKNVNYYDDKFLLQNIKDFSIACMSKQLQFGIHRNVAFCLGDDKNFKYLDKLNTECGFFEKIIPLSHPRFIMQYRLKDKHEFILHYLSQFRDFCT